MRKKLPEFIPTDDLPLYCSPPKFSKITGIDKREIRAMCKRQEIPNELLPTGNFRINTYGALEALERRTKEFNGHDDAEPEFKVYVPRRRDPNNVPDEQPACYQKYLDRLRGKGKRKRVV